MRSLLVLLDNFKYKEKASILGIISTIILYLVFFLTFLFPLIARLNYEDPLIYSRIQIMNNSLYNQTPLLFNLSLSLFSFTTNETLNNASQIFNFKIIDENLKKASNISYVWSNNNLNFCFNTSDLLLESDFSLEISLNKNLTNSQIFNIIQNCEIRYIFNEYSINPDSAMNQSLILIERKFRRRMSQIKINQNTTLVPNNKCNFNKGIFNVNYGLISSLNKNDLYYYSSDFQENFIEVSDSSKIFLISFHLNQDTILITRCNYQKLLTILAESFSLFLILDFFMRSMIKSILRTQIIYENLRKYFYDFEEIYLDFNSIKSIIGAFPTRKMKESKILESNFNRANSKKKKEFHSQLMHPVYEDEKSISSLMKSNKFKFNINQENTNKKRGSALSNLLMNKFPQEALHEPGSKRKSNLTYFNLEKNSSFFPNEESDLRIGNSSLDIPVVKKEKFDDNLIIVKQNSDNIINFSNEDVKKFVICVNFYKKMLLNFKFFSLFCCEMKKKQQFQDKFNSHLLEKYNKYTDESAIFKTVNEHKIIFRCFFNDYQMKMVRIIQKLNFFYQKEQKSEKNVNNLINSFVNFIQKSQEGKDFYNSRISKAYHDIRSKLTKTKKLDIIKELEDLEVEKIFSELKKGKS